MFIRWRTIKAFPKLVLVVTVLVGSTVLFWFWWYFKFSRTHSDSVRRKAEAAAVMKRTAATLPNRVERLFVAEGDLYDAESGNLVFKKWLRGDMPARLFYDSAAKKVYGQFDGGVNSYGLDGAQEQNLTVNQGIGFSDDYKEAYYARERDFWRSEVDWSAFKLINERQVTKLGTIQGAFMMRNMLLSSEHFVVLRNLNQTLRINISTGEVAPTRIPLAELRAGGRSPEAGVLMGHTSDRSGRQLFAYHLEKDEATTENIGRRAVNDFAWANDDRCFALVGGDTMFLYDRKRDEFIRLGTLPVSCQKLTGPSPDGRFIFALSRTRAVLVDAKEKEAEFFDDMGENFEWISNEAILISNDVPGPELRGIWYRKMGEEESVRVLAQPYLVTKTDESVLLVMQEPKWVIFATRNALFRLDTNGDGLKELAPVVRPVMHLQTISEWPPSATKE